MGMDVRTIRVVKETMMTTLKSKDGTTIAFDKQGDGPALILVNGAMSTRSDGSNPELARLLAQHFTVYAYDRRGRGDSGDTKPYAVGREIEDIDALIDKAGGYAFLYGHSSGVRSPLQRRSGGSEGLGSIHQEPDRSPGV